MSWYKKVLIKNKKEIINSAIISVIVTLAFSLWYFISGKGFEWQSISPISIPTLPSRLFYSALVYITLGAILYAVKFYKMLHILLVEILGDWKLYNFTKDIIWHILMFLMCFYIVPEAIDLLNAIASFSYNIAILILYLFPVFGIFLIIFITTILILRRANKNLGESSCAL